MLLNSNLTTYGNTTVPLKVSPGIAALTYENEYWFSKTIILPSHMTQGLDNYVVLVTPVFKNNAKNMRCIYSVTYGSNSFVIYAIDAQGNLDETDLFTVRFVVFGH